MARPHWHLIAITALAATLSGCGDAPDAPPAAPGRPPNLVLVIADDLAFRDLGFMGSEHVATPRLDAFAAEATVFVNGYGTASVCVPSIRSLLTGLDPYQWSMRMRELAQRGVYASRLEQSRHLPTLPRRLQRAGYTSFQGGKLWEASYALAGFDAGTVEALDVTRKNGRRDAIDVPLGRTTLEPLLRFIDEQSGRDAPFFVWFAPKLPHAPFDAPREFRRPYRDNGHARRATGYYANITRLDRVVGELLDHLALRTPDDTLVVFLSDNGWDQDPWVDPAQTPPDDWDGPHGKRTMYDLGFRTPVVFHWPGRIASASARPELVSTLDVVATLYDYAGVAPPTGAMGHSIRPLLEGASTWPREAVVGGMVRPRRGAPPPDDEEALLRWRSEPGAWFVRTPRWHYIHRAFSNEDELYDVVADPEEQVEISSQHPERVSALRDRIAAWRREVERDAVAFADRRRKKPQGGQSGVGAESGERAERP